MDTDTMYALVGRRENGIRTLIHEGPLSRRHAEWLKNTLVDTPFVLIMIVPLPLDPAVTPNDQIQASDPGSNGCLEERPSH
ncbi:MAG: hypothetical protein ACT4QC_01415 [Planctomycetaceae bacterium]